MIQKYISIIALLISFLTFIYSRKDQKKNVKYRETVHNFAIQNEKNRLLEKREDDIFARLSSRSTLIPYLYISIADSKVMHFREDDEEKIIIVISLKNLGKESAIDIELDPHTKNLDDYFKGVRIDERKNKVSYYVNEYFNNKFAISKNNVFFSFSKTILKENLTSYNDRVSFNIIFKDLIGSLYRQKFEISFGYNNYDLFLSNKYYCGAPELIKDKIICEQKKGL